MFKRNSKELAAEVAVILSTYAVSIALFTGAALYTNMSMKHAMIALSFTALIQVNNFILGNHLARREARKRWENWPMDRTM